MKIYFHIPTERRKYINGFAIYIFNIVYVEYYEAPS